MTKKLETSIWKLGHGRLIRLSGRSVIMGILNVTPDSFSDGGEFDSLSSALKHAEAMVGDGAEIVDIGGQSTRPGAETITAAQEQDRVLPIVEAICEAIDVAVSIDTYRATTAKLSLDAGAHIINDVWGFQKDPDIAAVAAETGAGVCAMHTGRERTKLSDVLADQKLFLEQSITRLKAAGVPDEAIVLDPGFGFAKNPAENIELLARFDELKLLGYPLLCGTSRKRFVGHFTGQDEQNRDIGTAATSVVARLKGASVFRVHDVSINRDALNIADAVLEKQNSTNGSIHVNL
ncbi:MAG: dihydropteroate synthase [Pseudomonadota bacterium]